jgi:hypothetical protein
MPAPERMPPDALSWISNKWMAALTVIFDKNRGCGECHDGRGPDGVFDTQKLLETLVQAKKVPLHAVAPVKLLSRFLPNARFDHARHQGMPCEDCHTTRKAEVIDQVALPGIETCRGCHGGEDAQLGTPSTCVTCHVFHRRGEFGPMHLTGGPMQ